MFTTLTETHLQNNDSQNINLMIDTIQNRIINAASHSIPRKSSHVRKPPVPWSNNDCKMAQNERTLAERALKRIFTLHNKI